jgi:hypothetical protein
MNYKEISEKVGKVKGSAERKALTTRWDDDLNIYLLDSHVMKGVHGELENMKLPGVYNVTSSAPQTYLDRITSIMSRAEPKLRIVSSIPDKQAEMIKNWWKGVIDSANDLQINSIDSYVYPSMCFYTNLRGWAATRNVIYKDEDGKLCFEILPIDIYDLYWEKIGGKYSWACINTLQMPKADILATYGLEIKGDYGDVYNFWDKDGNEITSTSDQDKGTPRNYIKRPPFTIKPVVTSPKISGANANRLKMIGESLYHSCRGTNKEINDVLSIIKTHAMLGLRPPLVHKTEGSEGREVKEYPTWGSILEQLAEEDFKVLDIKDMANTDAMFYNMMDQDRQNATIPNNEYGGLNFQLSALALDTLSGQRNVVFMPRQLTMELAYKDIFAQMLDQFIEGKFTMEMIDSDGKEKKITYSDLIPLQGKFRYDFDCDVESPEQEQATFTKATAAMNARMPMDFIVRDVFKTENPEKLLGIIADERLMEELPELRLIRAYDRAMQEAETLSGDSKDAKLLEAKMLNARIMQITAEMSGQNQPQAPQQMPQQMPEGM